MSSNSVYIPRGTILPQIDSLIRGASLSNERGEAASAVVAEHGREFAYYQSVLLPIMSKFYEMASDWFKELTGYNEKMKNTKDPESRSYYEKAFGHGRFLFRGLAIRAKEIWEKFYKPMQESQLASLKAQYDKQSKPIMNEISSLTKSADNADSLRKQLYSI